MKAIEDQAMTIVGAFARIALDVDGGVRGADGDVRGSLDALPGVETFDLGDPAKVGLLIEARDVDRAHAVLTEDIRNVKGVMGVWPVSVFDEDDLSVARRTVADASGRASGSAGTD